MRTLLKIEYTYRIVTVFFLLCMLISFLVLAHRENAEKIEAETNGWWSIYFNNPKENSIDFTIENNTDSTQFHYTVSIDGKTQRKTEYINVPKNTKYPVIFNDDTSKHTWKIEVQDEQKQLKSLIKRFE